MQFVKFGKLKTTQPAGAWTPAELSPLLWYDASQETFGDTNPMGSWSDQSLNNNNFSQTTGASQPTHVDQGGGLFSAHIQDGDYFEDTVAESMSFAPNCTIAVTAKMGAANGMRQVLHWGDFNTQWYTVRLGGAGGGAGQYAQLDFKDNLSQRTTGNIALNTQVPLDSFDILIMKVTGGRYVDVYQNGSLVAAGQYDFVSPIIDFGATTLKRYCGVTISNGSPWHSSPNVHFGELLVFNSPLSDTDRGNLETYLGRWQ